MSYRYMRILLMFDLPMETTNDLREYRIFRRELIKNGFFMVQKSVYAKLAYNTTSEKSIIDKIEKIKPKSGIVQILSVTEKQYSKMNTIVGELHTDTLDSDERIVYL